MNLFTGCNNQYSNKFDMLSKLDGISKKEIEDEIINERVLSSDRIFKLNE